MLQKKNMWFIGVEVEQETSTPHPKIRPWDNAIKCSSFGLCTFKLLSKVKNYLRMSFYWRLNYLQLFMICHSDSYLVTTFVHCIIWTFKLLSKIQNYLRIPFYWRLNYLELFMTCYSDSYLVATTIRTFKLLSTTAEAKINIGAHDGFIVKSCLTSSF